MTVFLPYTDLAAATGTVTADSLEINAEQDLQNGSQVDAVSLPGSTPVKPRVVSINLCADQLVMLLADDDQILSLSNLSHDSAGSYFYKKAQNFPINAGLSEQVLPYRPDLVIAGAYSPRHTMRMLSKSGVDLVKLPIASSMDTLFSNIEIMGKWLHQQKRSHEIIQRLKARLARLKPASTNNPPVATRAVAKTLAGRPLVGRPLVAKPLLAKPRAAVFDPNGYTVGAETLRGQMLKLSGWDNVANELGITHYGNLPLESLIMLRPEALIESPYSTGTWSRAQALAAHPALQHSALQPTIISIPSRQTMCAGPWTLDVIESLQQARLKLDDAPGYEKSQEKTHEIADEIKASKKPAVEKPRAPE